MTTLFEYKETVLSDKTTKYQLFQQGELLSFREVFRLWNEDEAFISFYNNILAQSPFSAFFWETPPVRQGDLDNDYEFVLVESRRLSSVQPDFRTFAKQFESAEQGVSTFGNLGGDAVLVVPVPDVPSGYPHIADFVRNASSHQIIQLWKSVAKAVDQRLSDKNMWLSTSGLGVYWMHIRLDDRPKYYTHSPYREWKC